MAKVFLSYDRDDAARAAPIAAALEQSGHSVWWDRHIKGGSKFSREIEQALADAEIVVVLWSQASIESDWVRDEAAAGRENGRLVPVSLDSTQPPLGFRQYQTIDLSPWKGRGKVPRLDEILAAIERQLKEPGVSASLPGGPVRRRVSKRLFLISACALLVLLLAGAYFLLARARFGPPTVAIKPADSSPRSQEMARNLLVNLGRLQASNPVSLELVGDDVDRADLFLRVSGSAPSSGSGANLALFTPGNHAMLWSRDYEQPNGRDADLREQLAYSAAQVLGCASEALKANLRAETRKLYLNGCAEFAQSSTDDVGGVLSTFEQVTRVAPGFRDGWAKLLLSEGSFAGETNLDVAREHVTSFRRHIAEARKHFPDLPEIQLGKIDLLPFDSYVERLRLADAAKRAAPDNAYVHSYRSGELQRVGRVNEALQDAELAARLDPLSPVLRNDWILMLAYAGLPERANEELKKAERLWPGAWSVLAAKFYFNLRYGDPAVALQILRQNGTGKMHEALLAASLDPNPTKIEHVLDMARAFLAQTHEIGSYAQILAKFGREDEIYSVLLDPKSDIAPIGSELFFRPNLKKFREDVRFMQVAKRFGLVDYWRTSGTWPDFCNEPGVPYDCKEEAAKLK